MANSSGLLPPPSIPLREWSYVHTELHWIYDHAVPKDFHDCFIENRRKGSGAWLVRKGRARIKSAAGQWTAGPGMWVFTPTEPFHQYFSADAHILSLNFLCHWPTGEHVLSNPDALVVPSAEHPALERKAVQLERMVRRHLPDADRRYYSCFSDYELFLTFHTHFLQWLTAWFKVQQQQGTTLTRLSADDDRLLRAVRCLNTSPLSEGIPHEALHRESGLGEAHLNRLFLAEYGMTLRKSWEQRRLAQAKSYLETSTTRVKEIAYSLGFKSDSHFMLWFKQNTGMRPKEYRQEHRTITAPKKT